MTEEQWQKYTSPMPILDFFRGRATDRKLRLFAAACCRRLWPTSGNDTPWDIVDAIEQSADAGVSPHGTSRLVRCTPHARTVEAVQPYAVQQAYAVQAAREAVQAAAHPEAWYAARAAARRAKVAAGAAAWYALLARGVTGTDLLSKARDAAWARERKEQAALFREILGNPFRPVRLDASWLAWNDARVVRLAQAAYDERQLPAGTLDPDRLAVLADALLEAGCDDADIIGHLRRPGAVHVRGCHVLDLLLNKG